MKIFDCFPFFNEEELLHLRFLEYFNVVDFFVISEATTTHTGKHKDLLFPKIKHKFEKYLSKVIYIPIYDLPIYNSKNIWIPENYQRNALIEGLKDKANLGDKIIISDCDEFWNVDALFSNINKKNSLCFQQKLYYYWVNCEHSTFWNGSVVSNYGSFQTLQELRNLARSNSLPCIPNGGWHYSYMGGVNKIQEKINNIAESEMIKDHIGTKEQMIQKMNNLQNLWDLTLYEPSQKNSYKRIINIDKTSIPVSLLEFLDHYPYFLKS